MIIKLKQEEFDLLIGMSEKKQTQSHNIWIFIVFTIFI